MIYEPLTIAKEIINKSEAELGDGMTNLKLQKLLYYVQGFHYAMYNSPAFNSNLEAWQYGPVVPEIYREFKKYGSLFIPKEENKPDIEINQQIKDLITEVYQVYGQYTGLALMNMTHNELPWKSTKIGEVIKPEYLIEYFKTQIVD